MVQGARAAARIAATMAGVALSCAVPVRADVAGTPAPSPSPRIGMHYSADGFASFVSWGTNGSGLIPPEGAGFAAGAPLAPNTPYDVFTSAALTPGNAGLAQFDLTGAYTGRGLNASATLGVAYAGGSAQTNAYWSENLLAPINPHLGVAHALPYQITFPTQAGQNDAQAGCVCILSGSIGTSDGALLVRGGWFDLAQTDRFVFAPAPLTSVTPTIGVQPAESLGKGAATLATWPSPPPGLPLSGVDVVAHRGIATLELANAALPSLSGTGARLTIGSFVLDHGEGTRWSAELAHVVTGGDLLSTTTMYGINAMVTPGPQGPLPTSNLGGQRQTVAGLRGAFHVARGLDAIAEVGRAWYDADEVLEPGTQAPGGFYHLLFAHPFGRASVSVEGFRFEGRYASVILPYGTSENVWSAAWSWPGVWLKSNYQLVDNTSAGSNRQGYRLRYTLDNGPIEIHASYARYGQIDQSTLSVVNQTGFVEGFFLPQDDGFGTTGVMHQYAVWSAWHPHFGDLQADFVDDTEHRDFAPGHPQDAVSFAAPQLVLTYSRSFGERAVADIGYGSYAMRGSWALGSATNVDYQQQLWFVGAQFAESDHEQLLVQLRQTGFHGLPSAPGGPSPQFVGTGLIFEQRFHI
jgi:hypothetical protein